MSDRANTAEATASTVSWIDPESPIGKALGNIGIALPDSRPPKHIYENFVKGGLKFRMSNHLHVRLDIVESHIVPIFCPNSGMLANRSLGILPDIYPIIQKATSFQTKEGTEGVMFEQTAGARTMAAEVLGKSIGELGMYAFPIPDPYRFFIGGLVGSTFASIFSMPPIWTHLELRLFANGQRPTCKLVSHSLFPSHSLYCNYKRKKEHKAGKTEQNKWQKNGWGAGNPWNVAKLFQQTDLGGAARVSKLRLLNSIKRVVQPLQKIRYYLADIIQRLVE